jgi:cytochrome b subunit of formate dehydrogenase
VQSVIGLLALLSLLTFILSLILLPYLIRRIPSDYFLKLSEEKPKLKGYSIKVLFLALVKNIFGLLLFISGIAMLFLPGQGLITIFISLLLMNFPGKRKLIAFLTRQKKVRTTMNWVRAKAGKSPLNWPSD